jgi:hypothetical protein
VKLTLLAIAFAKGAMPTSELEVFKRDSLQLYLWDDDEVID